MATFSRRNLSVEMTGWLFTIYSDSRWQYARDGSRLATWEKGIRAQTGTGD